MKKTLIFFLLGAILSSCSEHPMGSLEKSSDMDTVVNENPILKPSNDPFEKNGEEKTSYSNGVIRTQGNYRNGKRDGQWYSWYNTGKPWSETFFENGIKTGPTRTWFENGKLRYEGQFINDTKTGVWKYYDENGNLAKVLDHTIK